jgi:hypothetical protein
VKNWFQAFAFKCNLYRCMTASKKGLGKKATNFYNDGLARPAGRPVDRWTYGDGATSGRATATATSTTTYVTGAAAAGVGRCTLNQVDP